MIYHYKFPRKTRHRTITYRKADGSPDRTLLKKYNHGLIEALRQYSHEAKHFCLTEGYLLIRAAYTWDGASGPTRDRWFSGKATAVRGPLVHDVLYSLARRVLGPWDPSKNREYKRWQKVADKEFLRILKEDGMPWWRRRMWYAGVKWFGWRAITGQWQSDADKLKDQMGL